MKKIITIVIFILLIVLVARFRGSFSINIDSKNTTTATETINPTQSKNSSLETKESSEGTIAIAVTPLSLENSIWDFEIVLDTHSEELNFDLMAVTELADNQGKVYKPISWEGDGPTGHHRKGVLKFNSISSKPKNIELTIKDVGGVAERSFEWDL